MPKLSVVIMPGPVPGIHIIRATSLDVVVRDGPGHDEESDSTRSECAPVCATPVTA
jgi:hypothetical protein